MNVVKFFSKIFESRHISHIFHLKFKSEDGSYASHKALSEYYETVEGLIDDLVETYQGQYGIVDGYDIIDSSITKDLTDLKYFEDLVKSISLGRKCIDSEDTHLHNIVDEILSLAYRTIYKIKYLS